MHFHSTGLGMVKECDYEANYNHDRSDDNAIWIQWMRFITFKDSVVE